MCWTAPGSGERVAASLVPGQRVVFSRVRWLKYGNELTKDEKVNLRQAKKELAATGVGGGRVQEHR